MARIVRSCAILISPYEAFWHDASLDDCRLWGDGIHFSNSERAAYLRIRPLLGYIRNQRRTAP